MPDMPVARSMMRRHVLAALDPADSLATVGRQGMRLYGIPAVDDVGGAP